MQAYDTKDYWNNIRKHNISYITYNVLDTFVHNIERLRQQTGFRDVKIMCLRSRRADIRDLN